MPARATADYPALSARYADFFPGQPTGAPRSEAFRWSSGTLRLDRHGPRQAPLTVVLVHGAGGYGRMFAPLAAALVCADPLGGGNRVPVGLLASLFGTTPALEPEQFQRCPVLMLHPACDGWTPVAISDRFYQRLAAPK